MSDVRIAVATHSHSVVDFDVHFNHTWVISQWAKRYEITLLGVKGVKAAHAREMLSEQAIKCGCTHMLLLDDDHFVPVEMIDCFMELKDEAIVSGLVCKRGFPFQQVGWLVEPSGFFAELTLPIDGKLYQVGVCAFGCTMINISKLQKLEKPYFRDTFVKHADGKMYNKRSDINLCEAFRAIGEDVWIDTRVLIGHLGSGFIIYPQTKMSAEVLAKTYAEQLSRPVANGHHYVPSSIKMEGKQCT